MLFNFIAVNTNKVLHNNGVEVNERRRRVKKVLEIIDRAGFFNPAQDVIDVEEAGIEFEKESASESRAADAFIQEARIRHKQIELGIKPSVIQEPSTKKDKGESRLHKAVLMNDATSLKLFLEQGDNPKAKDNNGETPYAVAVGEENEALIKIFNDLEIDS